MAEDLLATVRHHASPEYAQQRILAEMLAQVAEDNGIRVDRIVPHPSGLSPYTGLRDETIEVYVEYTGTGLVGLGEPAVVDEDLAYDLVQQASAPDDVTWPPRLGFGNEYVLAVTPETAQRAALTRISDLATATLPPIRFATSTDFVRRPVDGLSALASRYGLAIDPGVLAADDKTELYRALRSGEVDVAVGFSTDPELADFDLTLLQDDLDSFPAYEAAPVARTSLLTQYPELEDALSDLESRIDTETRSELIAQVDFEQRDPAVVARDALVDVGLINGSVAQPRGDAVVVAMGLDDELSGARAAQSRRSAAPTSDARSPCCRWRTPPMPCCGACTNRDRGRGAGLRAQRSVRRAGSPREAPRSGGCCRASVGPGARGARHGHRRDRRRRWVREHERGNIADLGGGGNPGQRGHRRQARINDRRAGRRRARWRGGRSAGRQPAWPPAGAAGTR